jgi:hypothetical protein
LSLDASRFFTTGVVFVVVVTGLLAWLVVLLDGGGRGTANGMLLVVGLRPATALDGSALKGAGLIGI